MFHVADTSLRRIRACARRAKSIGGGDVLSKNHELYPAFCNFVMFMRAGFRQDRQKQWKKYWHHEQRQIGNMTADIMALDWFALKVDTYAKSHIVSTDETVKTMLGEWSEFIYFDPEKLKA